MYIYILYFMLYIYIGSVWHSIAVMHGQYLFERGIAGLPLFQNVFWTLRSSGFGGVKCIIHMTVMRCREIIDVNIFFCPLQKKTNTGPFWCLSPGFLRSNQGNMATFQKGANCHKLLAWLLCFCFEEETLSNVIVLVFQSVMSYLNELVNPMFCMLKLMMCFFTTWPSS